MPTLENDDLYQAAVLWEPSGTKNRYGEQLLGGPREISVRWENRNEQMLNPKGEVVLVQAVVVTDVPIPVGSEMWLGQLDQWPGTGMGEDVGGVMRVIASSSVPDERAWANRYVSGLRKSRDNPYTQS